MKFDREAMIPEPRSEIKERAGFAGGGAEELVSKLGKSEFQESCLRYTV